MNVEQAPNAFMLYWIRTSSRFESKISTELSSNQVRIVFFQLEFESWEHIESGSNFLF